MLFHRLGPTSCFHEVWLALKAKVASVKFGFPLTLNPHIHTKCCSQPVSIWL